MIYYRTCQECFHVQADVDPDAIAASRIDSYRNRKCKKCKSEALDWGSGRDPRAPVEKDDG